MMVCMAGLQVFIVRFFFQVCYLVQNPTCYAKNYILMGYRARGRAMCERIAMCWSSWNLEWEI